jgi:hypothetical protein
MSSSNGTSALRVHVALSERDTVKLILDFLQQRELYISMLDIERETGVLFASNQFESSLISLIRRTSAFRLQPRHHQWIVLGGHSLLAATDPRRAMGRRDRFRATVENDRLVRCQAIHLHRAEISVSGTAVSEN